MNFDRLRNAFRDGVADPWAASVLWKSSPSPPPAPDYTGAAVATAAGNADAARIASKANRVSQYTPYGNIVYTPGVNGDQDQWRLDYNLSPTGQQLLDYQNASSLGLGKQTTGALGRVDDALAKPFDFGSVGDVQKSAENAYLSRINPQLDIQEDKLRTKLATQGITQGSEAYNREMDTFGRQRNDATQQAVMAGINTMPQTYQMASALRSQPLNELNALRTGSQVTNPQFQSVPNQAATAGPDYLGAATAQGNAANNAYNAKVGQQNALMNGLFGLGSAAVPFLF